jgi:AraC-like DNA-binding protein
MKWDILHRKDVKKRKTVRLFGKKCVPLHHFLSMTLMRKSRYIIILPTVVAVLALMTACSKPDRSEEAVALSKEIVNNGLSDVEHSVARVDSAEQAGLFTAVRTNTTKAIIYENAVQRRLAAYYAEKAIAVEAGRAVTTSADSSLYCKARCILGDGAYADGEYGKSIALSKEILAFVGDGTTPNDVEMKCRALMQMADCENKLGHVAESERLFLQCIDILMESTKHATGFSEIDPLIYTLLSLNDLYIDNKMPEKALPLTAKMDTAMARLIRCPNTPDWVMQKRRNNVTISKAMVYAANGQREQAETLHREYQQFQGLGALDKAAEGLYLSMTGRYDEAVRLFDETDTMMRSNGEPVIDLYGKTLFKYKYDALQKAGRTVEALALGDRIRQLTDSISQQERLADVEQLQEIKRKENEITSRRQSLVVHRIILASAFIIILLIAYLLWRSYKYNKVLTEKNRRLLDEIEQREQESQQAIEQLEAAPEAELTTGQQLYRRLCELMKQPEIFTDPDTNTDMLARLLGTNRTYIYDAIRECADKTPVDFINSYRLRHAAHLLSTTNDSVGLIAELCGLSRRTFYRLFSETYAMSPSDYRHVAKK